MSETKIVLVKQGNRVIVFWRPINVKLLFRQKLYFMMIGIRWCRF